VRTVTGAITRDECDVVVVGSGAAALAAAIVAHDAGAEVAVLEKSEEIGGTSAVSGGVLWMPGNHHAFATPAERADDAARARDYVHALARMTDAPTPDDSLVNAFVANAGDALAVLEGTTPLRTAAIDGLSDYHFDDELPGVAGPGRSVEPVPYAAGDQLGEWAPRVARRGTLLSLGAVTTLGEDLQRPTVGLADELERRAADDVRTKGAALVAMLLRGVLDRGIRVETGAGAVELVAAHGGVGGVVVQRRAGRSAVDARRGVVLGCGGFEWNRALVRELVGYDVEPLTPPNNVGDGLAMALAIGAAHSQLHTYWGQPAMFDPTITRDGALVPQFEWARGAASSFVVDHTGARFANEALPYHEFARRIAERGAAPGAPRESRRAWLIFDEAVQRRLRILSVLPGDEPPDWFAPAATAGDLAQRIGVPPAALTRSLDRFNEHATRGEDPDFARTAAGMTGPGRVAPLTAPFFALALHPGTIGTNGGLQTDASARVRHADGGVIEGLYAVGNTAASPLGDVYPGAGSTLGPAVTFATLAGRHAAARVRR